MIVLLLNLSDGEHEILYTIYARTKRRLLYVATSYLGDRAEDAIHDVFIQLAEKYENKMAELCDKQDYYFVTIVKNYAIDLLRKESRVEMVDIDEEESVFADECTEPDRQAMAQDQVDRLMAHLDRLKPSYRQVLEYKYLLGYSNGEIAEKLGVSPSVVSTRLQRALKQMRERFEQEG